MILSRLRDRLEGGAPAFGTSLRYHDPAIVETIGGSWDFVWFDLQHGTIDPHHVPELARACDLAGISAFARLAGTAAPERVSYMLDFDLAGAVIAQVSSRDQAKAMVNAAKFPPLGDRSWGGRRIIDRQGRGYAAPANAQQLLILQIESPEGLAAADAIASTPGVDGLMIGPDDMCLRLGLPIGSPLFDGGLGDATRRMVAAARNHGKLAMGFGGATKATVDEAVRTGLNLISLGADATFIRQGSETFAGLAGEHRKTHPHG